MKLRVCYNVKTKLIVELMDVIQRASITKQVDEEVHEEMLFTHSPGEQEQNQINAENAKLVFSPRFIPIYPELLKAGLSHLEAAIFGFVSFYKIGVKNRFYFTNEQIGEVVSCSGDTVSRTVSKLVKMGLIKISRKIKANGGQVRFITEVKDFSDLTKTTSQTRLKLQTNNNKIKENISNIDIGDKSPVSSSKRVYGRETINELLVLFKDVFGYEASNNGGQAPRQTAWNIIQILTTRIKEKYPELTPEQIDKNIVSMMARYFRWVKQQEWGKEITGFKPLKNNLNKFIFKYQNGQIR